MKKFLNFLVVFCAFSAASISSPSESRADEKVKTEVSPDGHTVVKKKKSVDQFGTESKSVSKKHTKVHSDGTKETVVTTKTVTDPEGLLNRRAHATKVKTVEHPDGTVTTEQTSK